MPWAEARREGSLFGIRGDAARRGGMPCARGAVSLSNPRDEAPAGGAA
jgi:hypothetical protein